MAPVLIVADSQGKYLNKELDHSYSIYSISGMKVENVPDDVFNVAQKYSQIIIHLGTNNVPRDRPSVIFNKYKLLLKRIREINGQCDIYISGILPRARNLFWSTDSLERYSRLNEKAAVTNVYLQQLCQLFSGVSYIDNWNSFCCEGELQRQLLSKDGLHLSPKGIKTLADNFVLNGKINNLLLSSRFYFSSFPVSTLSAPVPKLPMPKRKTFYVKGKPCPFSKTPNPYSSQYFNEIRNSFQYCGSGSIFSFPIFTASQFPALKHSSKPLIPHSPHYFTEVRNNFLYSDVLTSNVSAPSQPKIPKHERFCVNGNFKLSSKTLNPSSRYYLENKNCDILNTKIYRSRIFVNSNLKKINKNRSNTLRNISEGEACNSNYRSKVFINSKFRNDRTESIPNLKFSVKNKKYHTRVFVNSSICGSKESKKPQLRLSKEKTLEDFSIKKHYTTFISEIVPVKNSILVTSPKKNFISQFKQKPSSDKSRPNKFKTKRVYGGGSDEMSENKVVNYPRTCTQCLISIPSRSYFYRHKKICQPMAVPQKTYPRTCERCNRVYKSKSSFSRHNKKCLELKESTTKEINVQNCNEIMPSKINYPRKCHRCFKTYKQRSSFYGHKFYCTNTEIHHICQICGMSFKIIYYLKRHLKKKICLTDKSQKSKCFLSECNIFFSRKTLLIDHLSVSHSSYSVSNLTFTNIDEFNEWKYKESCSKFLYLTKYNSFKQSENVRCHYYRCQFNNNNIKSYSSRKTSGRVPNFNCPCKLFVKEMPSYVQVLYISNHNHKIEFSNTVFQQQQRETISYIKSCLEIGINANRIQTNLQDGVCSIGKEIYFPKKEHFILLRNIKQIASRMKIANHSHPDDGTSVFLKIMSLSKEVNNPILIYKPQDENVLVGSTIPNLPPDVFAFGIQKQRQLDMMIKGSTKILCIDSTFNTNQYGFHLINFIVPDQYGNGYPVANFISNRCDTETLTCLFSTLKDRAPQLFINVLMTDDDDCFYKAMSKNFGEFNRFLCKWHVERSWDRQLVTKICDIQLRQEVRNILQSLLKERDIHTFKSNLELFLIKYRKLCKSFIQYFEIYYVPRVEIWAMCYRNFPHGNTDTNNFVESYHNLLKTKYFNRKPNKRLDSLIDILIEAEDQKCRELEHKCLLHKPENDINPNNRHKASISLKDCNVIKVNDNSWKVKSEKSGNFYSIILLRQECNIPDHCFLRCTEGFCVQLCQHMYRCSCPDREPLCKHIHKVQSFTHKDDYTSGLCIDDPVSNCNGQSDRKESHLLNSRDHTPHIKTKPNLLFHVQNYLRNLGHYITNMKVQKHILNHIFKILQSLCRKCEAIIKNASKLNITCNKVCKPKSGSRCRKIPTVKLYRTAKKKKIQKKTTLHNEKDSLQKLHDREVTITDPIDKSTDVTTTIFQPFQINLVCLKSLEIHLSDTELEILTAADDRFKKGWLIGSVIDSFLYHISKSEKQIAVINSYESYKLNLGGDPDLWENHVPSEIKKIFIPSHINNVHWVLIVVDVEDSNILLFDPFSDGNYPLDLDPESAISKILERWANILGDKTGKSFTLDTLPHTFQTDDYNCGVFVCWFAFQIINNSSLCDKFNPLIFRKYIYDTIIKNSVPAY